jgi:predicted transcriptional regulator
MSATNRTLIVTFRLRPDELARLDRLAERTQRRRSDVLRLLLDAAEPAEPRVVLDETKLQEVRHA